MIGKATLWQQLADWLQGTPMYVVVVLFATLVVQVFVNRVIKRAVRRAAAVGSRSRLAAEKRNARTIELTEILKGERREQRAESIGQLLRSAATLVIWSIGLLTVLTRVGIDIGPLLASAGVLGVALGFGAQALVKDYLAGIFVILEDQYGVGDVVDLGSAIGTVEEVTLRITRLRDLSGVVWYVRNGEIMRVANRSQGWTMAVIDIPVAYDEDLEQVRSIIEAVGVDMDDDPAYDDMLLGRPEWAGVEQVSGDAVFIRVFAKAAPEQQAAVARELRERVKVAFDRAGVRVPVLSRPFSAPPGPPSPKP